ncbi:glycosyltransferase family 39 protein [Rhodanobacter sp. L36]|uniref:ArnT family glycosyltransferase n=1 Tax=Rhodanobacter sp. L36 TaxID=1747221 RepID=UPI0020B146A8|nr:glycosyltransferase family 39 protein [Rhodanobacter sp. L36]
MKSHVPLSRSRPLWLSDARRELILFAVFALLVLGLGIGLRDPWPSDEPRFALAARWMAEHGEWLFPHRGHELYADKPPVFMWLQASAYQLVGNWRVAFLLPSLLAALGALALVYDLARRCWSHRSALLAAATLLVTIHFTYQMRNAQIDPLLLGWITLANYGMLRHLLVGPSWQWFAVGCFFAGVGVITKGVGVLAMLMLVPYLLARKQRWNQLAIIHGGWRWIGGLACFFVPILAWLLPMLLAARANGDAQHAEYVQDILFGQTVHRYAAPPGHFHSPLYFLGVIIFDWMPLSLLLPWAIPAWWRRCKRRDARFLLPLGWTFLVVVFFSLSPGKRDVYILPALPMIAFALAPLLPALLRMLRVRAAILALTFVMSASLAVTSAVALDVHPAWAARFEHELDPRIWWLFLAIGLAGFLITAITRLRQAPLGWLLFAATLWSMHGLWGYPLLNDDRSARDVMTRARAIAGPVATIGLVAWKEQNLLMAQGPVVEFGFVVPWRQQYSDAVAWLRAAPDQRWVFSLDEAMGHCVDRARAVRVGHASRRDWWIFRADAVKSGCVPAISDNATDKDSDAE